MNIRPHTFEIKFRSGVFKCDESISSHLVSVFAGEYEVPLFGRFRILDIGANFGSFSIWAAHRWPGSQIHAFEPHPEVFQSLEENVSSYHILRYNYGLGPPGFHPLRDGKHNSGEASIDMRCAGTKDTGVHVEIRDPLILPEADIIKIDTEGCEVNILKPLIEAGRRFKAIMFEYHCNDDRQILESLLKDYMLVKAKTSGPNIGVLCFIHKDEYHG